MTADEQQAQSQSTQALLEAVPTDNVHPDDPIEDLSVLTPIQNRYTFWYRCSTKKANYFDTIKPIGSFQSVERFWTIYNHLKRPSSYDSAEFHLFKFGIKPFWEDTNNQQGGKWMIRLPKGIASRYWEDILLAIVGEQFDVGSEICGAVISVRMNEDIISVWNRTADNKEAVDKIRDQIRRFVRLPTIIPIEYKRHANSIVEGSSYRNPTVVWRANTNKDNYNNNTNREHHTGNRNYPSNRENFNKDERFRNSNHQNATNNNTNGDRPLWKNRWSNNNNQNNDNHNNDDGNNHDREQNRRDFNQNRENVNGSNQDHNNSNNNNNSGGWRRRENQNEAGNNNYNNNNNYRSNNYRQNGYNRNNNRENGAENESSNFHRDRNGSEGNMQQSESSNNQVQKNAWANKAKMTTA